MLKTLNEQLKKNGGKHGAVIDVYKENHGKDGLTICYADGYRYWIQVFYNN